jgi:acyl-CoA thioesterase FadM
MNLFLRLLFTLIAGRFRPACSVNGPCVTPFRVWLTDLDLLGHMNNGVYFSILDVARVDLIIRSGLLGKLRAAGLYPVVAAETIRFRRSLRPFQRFDVVTRVIGRDDKAILIGQVFVAPGGQKEIMAEAVIRARFLRNGGGTVPVEEILQLAGGEDLPELEPWIAEWSRIQGDSTRSV